MTSAPSIFVTPPENNAVAKYLTEKGDSAFDDLFCLFFFRRVIVVAHVAVRERAQINSQFITIVHDLDCANLGMLRRIDNGPIRL